MEEEKGNTEQVVFDSDVPYPSETMVDEVIGKLHDRFGRVYGNFKVTIEFYPDEEGEEND